jgi:xanthine dehydrogenase accessory factor
MTGWTMSTWPTIERYLAEHGAAALVTLAQAQGSSPREPGARMVVAPDGRFTGTIGGGALEWGALAEAQALLARGDGAVTLDRALGPDLGQCCGGRVTLTIERFGGQEQETVERLAAAERNGPLVTVGTQRMRRLATAAEAALLSAGQILRRMPDGRLIERFGVEPTPFYLFGAGHVGRALSAALAPLPFAVTWIDTRPGAIPPDTAGVACVTGGDPVDTLARAPDGAFVAVMTHSHALDLDIVIAALRAKRFPYVGLIGSATKRARFASAMRNIGIETETINRLVCPIGLTAIRDKAPAAIAASIAAQLLMAREGLRVVEPMMHGEFQSREVRRG